MALAGLTGLAVLWPAGMALVRVVSHAGGATPETDPIQHVQAWALALRSVGIACGIGLLGVALGLPTAWALRASGRVGAGLLLAPLAMPSYLAFAGYTTWRAPGTWLGGAIAAGPSGLAAWVGQSLAVLCLGLWLAPMAALVLWPAVRRVDATSLDALALAGAGAWRRGWFVVSLLRRPLLAAWLVGALFALGSAVPLHLANVPTYAIWLWRVMDLSTDPGVVFRESWPLVVAALAGGVLVASRLSAQPWAALAGEPGPRATGAKAAAWGVWGLALVVPMAGFALSLRSATPVAKFWTELSPALLSSLGVAAAVGLASAATGACVWCALAAGTRPPRWTVWAVWGASVVWIAAGLLPGVLVGQATRWAWNAWPGFEGAGAAGGGWGVVGSVLRELGEGPVPLVLALLARFGWVGVLMGWLAARQESADARDLRLLQGAEGLWAWWRACVRGAWWPIAGAGLIALALSLHEIEASIVLQPVGTPSLARRMLELLHYLRDQDLAGAAINLAGLAMLPVLAAGILAGRAFAGPGRSSTD